MRPNEPPPVSASVPPPILLKRSVSTPLVCATAPVTVTACPAATVNGPFNMSVPAPPNV